MSSFASTLPEPARSHAALHPGRLAVAERAIGVVVEVPAALLVVADVLVLFLGVVSRYAFNAPLVWTDELASLLFIWLAMLGAVIAYRRAEHMRMTAFVSRARPGLRPFFDGVALSVGVGFLAAMLLPAFAFAVEKCRSPRRRWRFRTRGMRAHCRPDSPSCCWSG